MLTFTVPYVRIYMCMHSFKIAYKNFHVANSWVTIRKLISNLELTDNEYSYSRIKL